MVCFIMYKKIVSFSFIDSSLGISVRAHAAVILQYHHVSETLPAGHERERRIRLLEHLSYLKEHHDFNVIAS